MVKMGYRKDAMKPAIPKRLPKNPYLAGPAKPPNYPKMPTAIQAPHSLTPAELDQYLARGWRPLGQRIYTADFIQLELGAIYSVVPTRLPLQGHRWRKSQRKLLLQNGELFTYTIGPARIDAAKQRINELYLEEHPTKSSPDLAIHLEHDGRRIFDTLEINIFHGDQLVAFSYFDRGITSIYSKAGVYDPAYSRYSLGLYTMYLEIEWCLAQGLDYYYPGYISPDIPLFDYKLRMGDMEFWNLQAQAWEPYSAFDGGRHAPLTVLQERMGALQQALTRENLPSHAYEYLFFEMRLMDNNGGNYLDQPFFLLLHCPQAQECWIAVYNLVTGHYECWETIFRQRITFFDHSRRDNPLFRYVLEYRECFHQSEELEVTVAAIREALGDSAPHLRPREF
jgi:arginine-tRNA-protein transferase